MSLLVGTPPVLTLLSKITTRRTSHTLSLCVGRSLFLRTIQIRDALRRDPTGFLHSPPNHDQRGVRRALCANMSETGSTPVISVEGAEVEKHGFDA